MAQGFWGGAHLLPSGFNNLGSHGAAVLNYTKSAQRFLTVARFFCLGRLK